jgi:hypothetical protein
MNIFTPDCRFQSLNTPLTYLFADDPDPFEPQLKAEGVVYDHH